MDKDRPMSEPPIGPEDNLESLFAAEESAIVDAGFSQRVMTGVKGGGAWRKAAIYGAGLAGAGFAVGGITEMAPALRIAEWFGGVTASVNASVNSAVSSVDLAHAGTTMPDSIQLGIVAVIAGVSFLIAAVATQSR
jgi:hypothetical protein